MQVSTPAFLSVLARRLNSSTSPSFIAGRSLSIADAALAGLIFNSFYREGHGELREMLDKHEILEDYAKGLGKTFKMYVEYTKGEGMRL